MCPDVRGGNRRKGRGGCPLMGRRQFLTRAGLAGGAALALNTGLFSLSTRKVMGAPVLPGAGDGQARIRAAFSRPQDEYYMGWPGAAYDTAASQARYTEILEESAGRRNIELEIVSAPLRNTEHAADFLQETEEQGFDGALLTVMALHPDGWSAVDDVLEHRAEPRNLPTTVFAPQGVQFTPYLRARQDIPHSFIGATEDVEWLDSGLRLLNAVWQMAHTRLAVIQGTDEREEVVEPVGATLHYMPLDRFAEAYDATEGAEEAEAIARTYMENAEETLEPSEEEVLEAARTYLANRQIMEETGCHAVTMDCLGLVTQKRTPPPCMAYMQLLDEKTCGCCERDITSALSLMLSSYLCEKPAFLHNPTPNTVRNTYGGAHCTAPTLMDGFDEAPSSYILRNHHESDWGVAPQVLLREGQRATVMQFLGGFGSLMAATGSILHNIDTQPHDGVGGCRTAFQMEVDDVANVLDIRGHHNVLIYGDHLQDLRAWCRLAGVELEHLTGGAI